VTVGIEPEPTAEEAAAIAVALELFWPSVPAVQVSSRVDLSWRFSGRNWTSSRGWLSR